MRIMRWLHDLLHRQRVLAITLLAIVPVSCAAWKAKSGGRAGTVEASATASADLDARVDAKVQAALVQWKSEIRNDVKAEIAAQVGDRVGRDKNTTKTTTDSLTSIILAGGLIGAILLGLTLYYRSKHTGSDQVNRAIIGTIEKARERDTACRCGKCGDCIVRELRARGGRVGRLLHATVKKATG